MTQETLGGAGAKRSPPDIPYTYKLFVQEPHHHQADAVGDVFLGVGGFFEGFREVLVLGHFAHILFFGEDVADVFLVSVVSGVFHLGHAVAEEGDGRGLVPDVPDQGEELLQGVRLAADELREVLQLRVDLAGLVDLHGLRGILDDVQAVVHRHRDGRQVRAAQGTHQALGELLAEVLQEGVALRLAGFDLALEHIPLGRVHGGEHPDQGIGRLAQQFRLTGEEGSQVALAVEKVP